LVAGSDIAAGTLGALHAEGVFEFVKDNSDISAGDVLYWDADGDPVGGTAGTGAATTTAASNTLLAFAVADAGVYAGTVRGKLRGIEITATIAGSVEADDITGGDSTLTITGIAGTAEGNGGAVTIAGGDGGATSGNGGAVTISGGDAQNNDDDGG